MGFICVVLMGGIFLFSNRTEIRPQKTEEVAASKPADVPVVESTSDAVPGLPKIALGLTPNDQRKFVILLQILASHNDNDRRLDTEFKDLSSAVKHAMETYYEEIPSLKRNDRGTIVYLVGQNITEKSDVEFLRNVLMEKPCLSLSDCSKAAAPDGKDNIQGINETTANYPQLTALQKYVDQYRLIMGDPKADHTLGEKILAALKDSTHSPNPKVASDSSNALRYLTGHQ